MPVPQELLKLVERFNRFQDDYHRSRFNETQLRIDYLNPLFRLLGWDMDNQQGLSERVREVIHEYSLKTPDGSKAPDYGFRIGKDLKFFLEAKKPSVKIKEDHTPAFQLRSYAWNAKLPVSILSDFEEFAIYDCRFMPDRLDRASVARIEYFTFNQLPEKWEWLTNTFSKQAIQNGSFDQYAETTKAKRGTIDVDDAFLAEIEQWRESLAVDIAKRNPALTVMELNDAVQRTIDRIIFLRIAEDRGIEEYGKLQSLTNGERVYPRLLQLFHQADGRYNSGLFHFRKEKGQTEEPDNLTTEIEIADKPLKDIFRKLYYPSPYRFNVMPASVLGQVYEQFLGKVITLDNKHRATVELKPEVRKAGGVYYTPEYIARYIVENTIGKLLSKQQTANSKQQTANSKQQTANSKNIAPSDVSKLRFLDPACGSGSFLLVAYDFLLDWHLNFYTSNDPTKWSKGKNAAIYKTTDGWRLTTAEKRRILLNNIYGVDIDRQAVEVTKLSLLLKVLEGESDETLGKQLSLVHQRVLPDLGNNIKCGNSLIGSDFYDNPANASLDLETQKRINAFDWEHEFPEIMKNGGFDAVIGNPPYIRIQTANEIDLSYYSHSYETATGNYDIYCLFIERSIQILQPNGRIGMIVPHRFFKTDYGEGIRELLTSESMIEAIIDFDGYMVFEKASINTSIILLHRNSSQFCRLIQITSPKVSESVVAELLSRSDHQNPATDFTWIGDIDKESLSSRPWIFISTSEQSIWQKLSAITIRLTDVATHIFQGLKTGADGVFVGNRVSNLNEYLTLSFKESEQEYEIERDLMRPLIKGGEMNRYAIGSTNRYILFPYINGLLIPSSQMKEQFPKAWAYLQQNRELLERRDNGKMKNDKWYGYSRSQALDTMWKNKIITPDYYAHASYSIDEQGLYYFCGGGAGGYGILLPDTLNPYYILGLLNSKLLDYYLRKISMRAYQTAYMYVKKYIAQLPIVNLKISKSSDQARHDRMVSLVTQMLSLHKQLAEAKTSHDKNFLQRQIEQTDRKIDQLVYELYGLTEEEIAIVEGK